MSNRDHLMGFPPAAIPAAEAGNVAEWAMRPTVRASAWEHAICPHHEDPYPLGVPLRVQENWRGLGQFLPKVPLASREKATGSDMPGIAEHNAQIAHQHGLIGRSNSGYDVLNVKAADVLNYDPEQAPLPVKAEWTPPVLAVVPGKLAADCIAQLREVIARNGMDMQVPAERADEFRRQVREEIAKQQRAAQVRQAVVDMERSLRMQEVMREALPNWALRAVQEHQQGPATQRLREITGP